MSEPEAVGIVGAAGSLGSRLIVQACDVYDRVYTFDTIGDVSEFTAEFGVDEAVKPGEVSGIPVPVPSVHGILESCAVVHWCAPIHTVEEVEALPPGSLLVLHDSVMHNSVLAGEMLKQRPSVLGKIGIVHCIMNAERRVGVATNTSGTDEAHEHMAKLGLRPDEITPEEHDFMMAHSQAPLAMLSKVLNGMLVEIKNRGYLPPSANELKEVLDGRASKWTPATFATIMSNPELPELVGALEALLRPPAELPASRLDIGH